MIHEYLGKSMHGLAVIEPARCVQWVKQSKVTCSVVSELRQTKTIHARTIHQAEQSCGLQSAWGGALTSMTPDRESNKRQ